MKFNTLFIPAGISCMLLIGCNQPQKKASLGNDDIIWKANVSYCISTEKLDTGALDWGHGLELEIAKMYNFKITEEKGKFRDLMRLFYDSANSKTYPLYSLNPVTGLSPDYVLLPKEKDMTFNDSIWNNDHTKVTIIPDVFKCMVGITLNHEWLYDAKVGTLLSAITDASLLAKGMPNSGTALLSLAGFKFSNRAIDSLGTDQPGLNSSIVWGRDELMSIIDSGQGLKSRTDHSFWYKSDTLSDYFPLFPQPIRTNFNKKLAEWIWLAARSGQLQAYTCKGKDEIGEQIPLKDIKEFGSTIDTVMDEHGNPVVVKSLIDKGWLTGLELKEEIAFHKNTFNFESKITYAGVLIMTLNHYTGQSIPNKSTVLYWVKLN